MEPHERYADPVYQGAASLTSDQVLPEKDAEEQPVDDFSPQQSARPRPLPDIPSQGNLPHRMPQARGRSRIPRPSAGAPSLRLVPKEEPEPEATPEATPEPMPKSCLATTSASSSSRSVRFLLPEGHQDSFEDDVEENASSLTRDSCSQDVTMNSLYEDSDEYELEDLSGTSKIKHRNYVVDSKRVVNQQHIAEQYRIADQHYIGDQTHATDQDPVANTEHIIDDGRDTDFQQRGDSHQQPVPLPLSMRLGHEPPYPPPAFPPPAPPFPPRESSMRGLPRVLTHAELLPQEGNQRTEFPANRTTASLEKDEGTPSTTNSPPHDTTQPGPSESAETPPPSTAGIQTVLPSFGSTPTESSGSFSPLHQRTLEIDQPVHIVHTGRRAPIFIHPNTTHHSLQAPTVDESEMPAIRANSSGSPIYMGAPTGLLTQRSASASDRTPTQGPSNSSPALEGISEANRDMSRNNGEHTLSVYYREKGTIATNYSGTYRHPSGSNGRHRRAPTPRSRAVRSSIFKSYWIYPHGRRTSSRRRCQ
ncbi:hypothetical protein F5Y13DRAFT_50531 [Hypoxylon sp. FL1857]|nr:hypothetical protein F5Y13DRAFT_50531 [Hypoxylon sp. FL1857]